MARIRFYIKPFNPDGTYASSWTEVTRDVIPGGLGKIKLALDVNDYDVGVFANSGISIQLRNDRGLYSDVGSTYSMFQYKRADSLVKVTWDMADYDYQAGVARSFDILGNETTIFMGLLSDEATTMQVTDQTLRFQVLGLESCLDRGAGPDWVGSPPASNKCSDLIKTLLPIANAAMTQSVLTIDNAQINPANDVSMDDYAAFKNMTCRDIINDLLTASNSVLYMNGQTPVVSGRTQSSDLKFTFYGPGSSAKPENIYEMMDIRTGTNRVFNFVTFGKDNAYLSTDATSIAKYGVRKKNVQVDAVTTGTAQTIIDALKLEFSTPKMELTLSTPITYSALAIPLLGKVNIDYPSVVVSGSNVAYYGIGQYGVNYYADVLSTFEIDTTSFFKVLGIEIDLEAQKIGFQLRGV